MAEKNKVCVSALCVGILCVGVLYVGVLCVGLLCVGLSCIGVLRVGILFGLCSSVICVLLCSLCFCYLYAIRNVRFVCVYTI